MPTGLLHAGVSLDEDGRLQWCGKGSLEIAYPGKFVSQLASKGGQLPWALRDDGHSAIFEKLLANCCFAPLAVLTRLPNASIAAEPMLAKLQRRIGSELTALADRLELSVHFDLNGVLAAGASFGPDFKASMLVDAEAGRPTEHCAQLLAPCALAEAVGKPMPTLQAVSWLTTALLTSYQNIRI